MPLDQLISRGVSPVVISCLELGVLQGTWSHCEDRDSQLGCDPSESAPQPPLAQSRPLCAQAHLEERPKWGQTQDLTVTPPSRSTCCHGGDRQGLIPEQSSPPSTDIPTKTLSCESLRRNESTKTELCGVPGVVCAFRVLEGKPGTPPDCCGQSRMLRTAQEVGPREGLLGGGAVTCSSLPSTASPCPTLSP